MINFLFTQSVLSLFSYLYTDIYSTKSNFLLFPSLSLIISMYSTISDTNFNIARLNINIHKLSILWTFVWLTNLQYTSELLALLLTSYLLYHFCLDSQILHFTSKLILTYINLKSALLITHTPTNEFFTIGSTITLLATCNCLVRYTLRELNIDSVHISHCSENITCVIFQLYFCYFTLYNYLNYTNSEIYQDRTLQTITTLFGYFIYDTISLLKSGRVDKQIVYLTHHIISIYLLLILFFSCKIHISIQNYVNQFLILLESINPILNTMKTLKILSPKTEIYYFSRFIARVAYVSTRIITLPLFIVYLYTDRSVKLNSFILNQILAGLVIIFFASVLWCKYLFTSKF
jgi:hypothetical protein